VYCPDVAVHRLWVHEGTDLFLVTSPAAAASVRRFRPRAPVAVVPPPVRRAFYDAPSRREARQQLEIPDDARCVLLIDSGWGFAPIAAAAVRLADAGVHVLAVAGRNRRLERELRDAAGHHRLLTPFGFTDAVPRLMAAADLVVSLPGATTCSFTGGSTSGPARSPRCPPRCSAARRPRPAACAKAANSSSSSAAAPRSAEGRYRGPHRFHQDRSKSRPRTETPSRLLRVN
jgi:hypothetical protein